MGASKPAGSAMTCWAFLQSANWLTLITLGMLRQSCSEIRAVQRADAASDQWIYG